MNIEKTAIDALSLCGLFGDAIKKSIVETLAAEEWPFVDAQPIAARVARLAEIKAQVDKLRAEQAGLQPLIDQYAGAA